MRLDSTTATASRRERAPPTHDTTRSPTAASRPISNPRPHVSQPSRSSDEFASVFASSYCDPTTREIRQTRFLCPCISRLGKVSLSLGRPFPSPVCRSFPFPHPRLLSRSSPFPPQPPVPFDIPRHSNGLDECRRGPCQTRAATHIPYRTSARLESWNGPDIPPKTTAWQTPAAATAVVRSAGHRDDDGASRRALSSST